MLDTPPARKSGPLPAHLPRPQAFASGVDFIALLGIANCRIPDRGGRPGLDRKDRSLQDRGQDAVAVAAGKVTG